MDGMGALLSGFAGSYQARMDSDAKAAADAQAAKAAQSNGQPQQPALGAYPPAQQPTQSNMAAPTDGTTPTLQGLVDRTEGGGNYSTLYGNAQDGAFKGTDVSKMTLGQLYNFTDPNGEYAQFVKAKTGTVATPVGRNQIIGTTLAAAAKQMGLPDNTVYTPQVQDAIFTHLANQRLAGQTTMASKMTALRNEWNGYKNVPDAELSAAITKYEAAGNTLPTAPLGATPPQGATQ